MAQGSEGQSDVAIIRKALGETMAHLDALRGLVLAMLDASKDKDSILAGFSEQSGKLSDLLLDSEFSDGFLETHRKAHEALLRLASGSRKPL
ncbi:MAG: hypothetical protein Q8L95_02600 [Burkholderiales bacterium]|nr:hypothetical protein [Burkholderiales bacterium]